jgi:hypothetical protein
LDAHTPEDVRFHHGLVLQAWRSMLGTRRAIYLSGPITTGLIWVEAVEAGRTVDGRSAVIAENALRIGEAAEHLRRETGDVILEPATLTVKGWSQDDYLALWTTFIERHASEVRFVPNWQYSIGCAREFEAALRHGVPTKDLAGGTIAAEDGLLAIRAAASDVRRRSAEAHPLLRLADDLQQAADRVASP